MKRILVLALCIIPLFTVYAAGPGGDQPGGGQSGPGGSGGNQPDQPGGGSSGGGGGSFTYDTFLTDSTVSDGAIAFTNLWTGYDTAATTITAPAGITALVPGVCAGNTAITSVDLSATAITELPIAAFRGCTNLTSVTLPATCTAIGDGAFSGCRSITAVHTSVASFGADAYYESGVTAPELVEWFVTNATAAVTAPASYSRSSLDTWLSDEANRASYLYASVVATNADFTTALTVEGTNFIFTAQDVATLRSVGAELQVCTDLVEGDWKGVVESDIVDGVYTMPSATNAFARIRYTLR